MNNDGNDTHVSSLVFMTADNFPYPLRSVSIIDVHDPSHPGRIWTNESGSTHEPVSITVPASLRIETDVINGTRVWINNTFAGRFEVFVFGGRNTLFSWSQMALVAPLDRVEGGVDGIVLEAGVDTYLSGKDANETYSGLPVGNNAGMLRMTLVQRLGTAITLVAVTVLLL